MSQTSLPYRPEIDGLRAIAVVAVVIYHLKLTIGGAHLMSGGFLGVDLFFVLSGFLITGILLEEFQTRGRISLAQFYWRRAKRILPPLLLVMLVSLPAAWMLLLPTEMERFTLSLLAALAFLSNGFWYQELSEYGAQSGLLQPFLHTWSLAIEEQFYLIFPLLLMLLLPRLSARGLLICLSGLCLSGLVVAQLTTQAHPNLSFYAPTSRAWEMLAGAVLAALSRSRAPAPGGLWRLVPALSLAVLGWSLATRDLVEMAHPGLGTLPVILATCGLIWCATQGDPVTRLLSTRTMVWIGKLSYSIYLWHFPVFAFGRIQAVGSPTLAEMGLWLLMTLALSVAGYHLVEKPFRFRVPPKPFAGIAAAALVPVVAVAVLAQTGTGKGRRAAALAELYGENVIDNAVLAQQSWSVIDARFPDEDFGPWNATRPSVAGSTKLWFEHDDSRKVLILGDSLSRDFYNAFVLNAARYPNTEFARFNLHRRTVAENLRTLLSTPNFAASDVVVIAPNYYRDYTAYLDQTLDAISGHGKAIYVAGHTARFAVGGAQPLFDWYLIRSGDPAALADLNALAAAYENDRARAQNAEIRAIAEAAGATYLPRRELVCPDAQTCTLVSERGLKTMYDGLHWTLEGAAIFGARAADRGWLMPRPPPAGKVDG